MPVSTFDIAVSTDDGQVAGSGAAYPPAFSSATTGNLTDQAAKDFAAGPFYNLRNVLQRFDTSPLPDTAVVTAAALLWFLTGVQVHDALNLVGEWYAASNWPIDVGDGAVTPAATAFSVPLANLTAGIVNTIPLTTPANVNLTGFTGFRVGIDGGPPTVGTNNMNVNAFDSISNPKPQLQVTWTATGGGGGGALLGGII